MTKKFALSETTTADKPGHPSAGPASPVDDADISTSPANPANSPSNPARQTSLSVSREFSFLSINHDPEVSAFIWMYLNLILLIVIQ